MRSLELDASAFEDLAWWVEKDRTQALRIIRLIRDVLRGETIEGRSLAPAS